MNLELQSERLLLRPLSESDLDISLEILTDPKVMRYIAAVTDPDNEVSKSVLLKSGLRYEGMRRAYASDCPGYRITRQQWLAENAIGVGS